MGIEIETAIGQVSRDHLESLRISLRGRAFILNFARVQDESVKHETENSAPHRRPHLFAFRPSIFLFPEIDAFANVRPHLS